MRTACHGHDCCPCRSRDREAQFSGSWGGRVVARGVAFTAATVAAAVLVALVVNAGIGTTWVSLLAASVAVLAGAVLALRLASW